MAFKDEDIKELYENDLAEKEDIMNRRGKSKYSRDGYKELIKAPENKIIRSEEKQGNYK